MSTGLLACPFCGASPRLSWHMDESLWNHDEARWERVVCDNCDCGTRYVCEGEESTAREIWNNRVTPNA